MARPYSMDLRERVVGVVEREGLSRRQAAARFGVGIKTVIDWVRRFRETGSLAAKRMGGHRPKKISGTHRDWLLQRCRNEDFTLRGLVRLANGWFQPSPQHRLEMLSLNVRELLATREMLLARGF